jgi:hypothetical protein
MLDMSTAELNKKKLDLIAWINKLSDENTIELLSNLKESKLKTDWWNELPQSQKELIEIGLNDLAENKLMNAKEFWNELKNGKQE